MIWLHALALIVTAAALPRLPSPFTASDEAPEGEA